MSSSPSVTTELFVGGLLNPPKSGDVFLRADYWELRALISPDREFTLDAWKEAHEEDLDNAIDNEWDEYADHDPHPEDRPQPDDVLAEIHRRSLRFDVVYPFQLSGETLRLRDDPRPANAYLFLLLCSSLRCISKKKYALLTTGFEDYSLAVFRALMPMNAEVHLAGKHPDSYYKGHAFDRLTGIARDFRGRLDVAKSDFSPHDSGDSGFDLVAWYGMEDNRASIPIFSAQSGCGARDAFGMKPMEGSHVAQTNITVWPGWSSYYFTPLDLHGPNNNWHHRSDKKNVVYVDRLRFLRLAQRSAISLPSRAEQVLAELRLNQTC